MTMTEQSDRNYVLGHTDRERRRLLLQAAVINPITEDLLRRAGLSTPDWPAWKGGCRGYRRGSPGDGPEPRG
jgi:hypothetical protein